ncbi:MAG: DUF4349 domain-containing protein [Lachnospiraceae bacterium]|nr:DUF4349 domain-containing protein [Lachnospiraceae bacterium]
MGRNKIEVVMISLALSMVFLLTSCGMINTDSYLAKTRVMDSSPVMSASAQEQVNGSAEFASETTYMKDSYVTAGAGANEVSAGEAEIVRDYNMIIRNAEVSLDVSNLESFLDQLHSATEKMEGYLESSSINDYDSEYASSRYGYFTARVPQEKLDDFLAELGDGEHVSSVTISTEDVSLQYADIEARIRALKTEQKTLEELLEKAEEVEDLITVRNELSNINYQLDDFERQRRSLSHQVNYSTVTINAKEERIIQDPATPAFKVEFKARMIQGLSDTLNLVVGVIAALPSILFVFVLFVIAVFVLKILFSLMFRRKGTALHYALIPVSYDERTKAVDKEKTKRSAADNSVRQGMEKAEDTENNTESKGNIDADAKE